MYPITPTPSARTNLPRVYYIIIYINIYISLNRVIYAVQSRRHRLPNDGGGGVDPEK